MVNIKKKNLADPIGNVGKPFFFKYNLKIF